MSKIFSFYFSLILALLAFQISFSQEIKYSSGNNSWNADELGNHRAVVRVTESKRAARVIIQWRRHDKDADEKNIIVTTADGTIIKNVMHGDYNREFGGVLFEAINGAGIYYVYYMPYKKAGSANYPKDFYPKFDYKTPTEVWTEDANGKSSVSEAQLVEIQSINEFNSFYPMEVIATKAETNDLIANNSDKSFLIFPEDRMFPIKMTDDLPQRWIQKGLQNSFRYFKEEKMSNIVTTHL